MLVRSKYCTGRNAQITINNYFIIGSTGYIAILVLNNIHVNNAVLRSDSSIAIFQNVKNLYFATVNVNLTAAHINKKAISITKEIYITVDSYAAAFCIIIVTRNIYSGCTIIFIAATVAINICFYIAIDNNIAFGINTHGIVSTICFNIHVSINSKLGISIIQSHTLQACIRNLSTSKIHFYGSSFDRQSIGIVNFNT